MHFGSVYMKYRMAVTVKVIGCYKVGIHSVNKIKAVLFHLVQSTVYKNTAALLKALYNFTCGIVRMRRRAVGIYVVYFITTVFYGQQNYHLLIILTQITFKKQQNTKKCDLFQFFCILALLEKYI